MLIEKFLTWFNKINKDTPSLGFDFHGCWNGDIGFWNADGNDKYFITLREWNNLLFGLITNEQFEKGEEVLVRENDWKDTTSWVTAIFLTEFEGKFVVDWDEELYYFDQCKKKTERT